jgi:iron complex outermembrane receptor protein
LEGAHVSREKVIPTASYSTVFNDARNRTTDEQSYLNLKYENHFGSQLGVMARVYYNRYFYHGDYLYDRVGSGDPVDFVLNKDFSWGSWWGAEVQLTKKVLEKYQFVIGAEYRDNLRQDQENYDEAPYFQYLDDKRNSQIWAIYLQGEIPILNNLKLNAGVRYDRYDTFGDTTNPRLALIYNPLKKTFIKLLYGTAFRAPNVYEFYYQDGGNTSKSNPRLQPEKIETYELVWEQYLGNSWRLVTSGYYYKIKDLISQETDPQDGLLIYNNIEEIQARGVELGLEGKWGKFLEGRISYSFQETENRLTRNSLTNSPNHLAKLNLTAPLIPGKVFVGLEEQYTSQRKTLAGNEADSFFVTNLTLFSRNLLKGLEASVSVYNLFDNKYSDPGAAEHTQDLLQQDGRSFRFKLTYKF